MVLLKRTRLQASVSMHLRCYTDAYPCSTSIRQKLQTVRRHAVTFWSAVAQYLQSVGGQCHPVALLSMMNALESAGLPLQQHVPNAISTLSRYIAGLQPSQLKTLLVRLAEVRGPATHGTLPEHQWHALATPWSNQLRLQHACMVGRTLCVSQSARHRCSGDGSVLQEDVSAELVRDAVLAASAQASPHWTAANVADAAWALARLGLQCPVLFARVQQDADSLWTQLLAPHVANLAWALSQWQVRKPAVYEHATRRALVLLHEGSCQVTYLAKLLAAFAAVGYAPPQQVLLLSGLKGPCACHVLPYADT